MKFTIKEKREVEYSSCDLYGIMHNIEYFTWIEDALQQFLEREGIEENWKTQMGQCRFLHSLKRNDPVKIQIEIDYYPKNLNYRGKFINTQTGQKTLIF